MAFISSGQCGQGAAEAYTSMKVGELLPIEHESIRFNNSDEIDTVKVEYFESIISRNGLDTTRITNLREVNQRNQDDILDLLFNISPGSSEIEEVSECYIPRHVVLFYNDQASLVGIVEICFECERTKSFGVSANWTIQIDRVGFNKLQTLVNRILDS